MKIVHVTNVISPDKLGGLERYVRELAAAQVSVGHEVVIASKSLTALVPPKELGEDGVVLRRHSSPSKSSVLFALMYPFVIFAGVRKIMREEVKRADLTEGQTIVHAHFPVPALALAVLRIPFIYTFHAPVYREMVGERQGSYALPGIAERVAVFGMKLTERLVLNRARMILTLSDFIAGEARELGVPAKKIKIIPGGLDEVRFALGLTGVSASAVSTPSGPRLFAARRFVERTGVEQLVEAMAAVRDVIPGVTLRLAGSGPREAQVRALVEKFDLEKVVQLLGRIPDDQLVLEYKDATLTVTPTLYLEGFGLSTAESLSVGTPALVTPVGANPELVAELSPSLVADGTSAADLSRALIRLLGDSGYLEELRGRLQSGFASRWGWSNVVRQITEVYWGLGGI
ncbi:glycosyltransferase family 4 protein [Sinomonas sp. ASV322]|uniref:glycosyltransferase family 4 protein n=1 Tax=Sinomonas sp. ASV322 TaxID=3041920 RepID=UPI0027DCA87F|nr:glycosyltransferase family 4 protein [Sinomonas sp. ASV322]MDQ4502983.1 glycosyltransferase family 4 protein [Sinomonas sp. ASV322]